MTELKDRRCVKIIRKGGEKFFCDMDVNEHGDLIEQGCRRDSEDPDLFV